ncbi:MAG TPA: quinoprotein dehydrogenase-associated SoxYZ-like carrier [Beijerinckiaceae bacterium]|nr:quinoprotein dehydrogenase-associated SoxYZ-like carrier [Methylobacteriaceae bacterium]MCC0001877.1 quinoprotein dehydrogenase-associated SoxYZ-like carrier [Methylobacteriaceae bacterium]HRY01907.1 quinoprotein dehydrogenase-associated SoxYZ-like carrier [Beijerinckiaceae bacterium]
MTRQGSAARPIALFSLLWLALAGAPSHAQGISPAPAPAKSGEAAEVWTSLAKEIFHGAPLTDGEDIVRLRMPVQYYDSSLVPVTITLEKPATTIRKLTLVIDQNPAPLAASFVIGPQSGLTTLSTRVRINNYTDVHLVAERLDGSLYDVRRWVLAADGCSAISAKNRDEIAARMGTMEFSDILAGDVASAHRREAQIRLRHPNYSGMQMDHNTGNYIPARYIDRFVVKQGDDLIFEMTGGISMSEDPTFRFTYQPNGAKMLSVEARDSDGTTWKAQYPVGGAS